MKNFKIGLGYLFIFGISLMVIISMRSATGKVQSDKPIIFDHYYHLNEVGLSCADCHSGVENLAVGGRAMPTHDDCASCHTIDEATSCQMCHKDPNNPIGMPPAGNYYHGFAHANHVKAGLDCAQCHSEMNKANASPVIPIMQDCQSCHLQKSASLNCETCHDGTKPLPENHKFFTWASSDHGMEAKHPTSDCASCHTQNSCDQCHQGVNLTGTPHPPHFIFNHSVEVGFGAQCMSCHDTRSQCVDCHIRMLPIPHPLGSGFANNTDGGEHVREFQMFTETCLACHDVSNKSSQQMSTCARCHN